MRTIFIIGHNDLRMFLRNPASYIWLIGIPVIMIFFVSMGARAPGGPNAPRPSVRVENHDEGFLGGIFLAELGEQGLRIEDASARDAKRGITIPADFTANVLERKRVELEFFRVEGSDDAQAALIQIRLFRAVVALNAHLIEAVKRNGGAAPQKEAMRAMVDAANPVVLQTTFAGRKPTPVGYSQSVPAMMVMYVLINLMIFGGAALANDRRAGVLRRMVANPVRRRELIFGKLYGLLLLGLVQVAFYVIAGRYAFDVPFGDNLPGVMLLMFALAWMAAGLGLLIGSMSRSEDKVVGISLAIGLPMAALGGCWWPMEVMPDSVQTAVQVLPTTWAMNGLHQLITFGAGFGSVISALLVLAGFGLVANLAAIRFFRV